MVLVYGEYTVQEFLNVMLRTNTQPEIVKADVE